jgi:hypothetical protein
LAGLELGVEHLQAAQPEHLAREAELDVGVDALDDHRLPGVAQDHPEGLHQVEAQELPRLRGAANGHAVVLDHDVPVSAHRDGGAEVPAHVLPLARRGLQGAAERDGDQHGRHQLLVRDREAPGRLGSAGHAADLHRHRMVGARVACETTIDA